MLPLYSLLLLSRFIVIKWSRKWSRPESQQLNGNVKGKSVKNYQYTTIHCNLAHKPKIIRFRFLGE